MKYETAKMGTAEGIALAFIMTFPPVFLVTPAISVEKTGSISWAATIPGALTVTASVWLLSLVYKRFQGDLIAMTEQFLGKLAAKVICLYYMGMFFALAVFWTREFAEDTLLTALPNIDFNFALIWYMLAAVVAVYLGLEAISRAAYLILPFIAGGLILLLFMLYPFWEFNYIFPWQGHGLDKLAVQSISLIGLHAGAIILAVFAPSFQNEQTIRKGAVFGIISSAALRSLSTIVFIMVFGPRIAMEKTLPFYEMARLVYFSRYIQRIESIFILVWVVVGILAIALCLYTGLYLLSRFASLTTIRPLIPAVAVILTQLAIMPRDVTTTVDLVVKLYTFYNTVGAVLIPLIIFSAAMVKGRRKKTCMHEQ